MYIHTSIKHDNDLMNCRVCLFNLTILLCRNENVAEAAGHKLLGARILPTLLGDDEFK